MSAAEEVKYTAVTLLSARNPSNPSNLAYLEDALQEGIVGSKAVMGGGAPAKQKGHGVSLIPKGGLDTNEHVAKLLAIDQQVLTLGVQLACTISLSI